MNTAHMNYTVVFSMIVPCGLFISAYIVYVPTCTLCVCPLHCVERYHSFVSD